MAAASLAEYELHERFRRDDIVITPTDEEAVVLQVRPGAVFLRYRHALNQKNAQLTLPAYLLAPWRPGQPRPAPVRVPLR